MKKKVDFKSFGIFGFPLGHTLSPAMQEAAFAALGLKAFYLVLELDRPHFHKVFGNIERLRLGGFNVTVPYKEEVIPYLDRLTPRARGIGAVNTVLYQGRKWIGTNTDVDGFLLSLERDGKFRPRGKKTLIFGAGGGARAVAYGLADEGARSIAITDIYPEKVGKLFKDLKPLFPKTEWITVAQNEEELKTVLRDVDLVVNATAMGLKPDDPVIIRASWIPQGSAKRRMLFYDLIYRPSVTPFLKVARRRGHRAVNGLGMLLYQGAKAFEFWTQKKAPVPVMRRVLENALKSNP
ncbi:MAG: shikimate dehydrogenase [Candidatus Omnitrophica bacterium]|nr:shikimate dehydrogenase [Candidatus Omnitrophota bacterium]MDD5670379.1 shikimate dehydrogenase [Candidatus Omnitrophota bacterium]